MQDPNEDTEWNDVLRAKGIIPEKQKKDITEDDVVNMIEDTIAQKTNGEKNIEDMSLDELDEIEDEEEERILQQMRQKRMAEIKERESKAKFGEVREITAIDYVSEVNEAGEGIFVVLHLYKQGIPLCTLINNYMSQLAVKFPETKFLKSISTTCIPNFPDMNLPTIFVYFQNEMKSQMVGAHNFRGMNMTIEEFEYLLGKTGAVNTQITTDPRPKIKDSLFSALAKAVEDDDDGNDW